MNIRITDENLKILEEISSKKGVSKSTLINNAISELYKSGNPDCRISDKELDYMIKYFEKSSLGINLRLNARESAINSQILIEMMNSICSTAAYKFANTNLKPSTIYKMAKEAVNFKIEEAKRKRGLL